jgi:hypothetical protein
MDSAMDPRRTVRIDVEPLQLRRLAAERRLSSPSGYFTAADSCGQNTDRR